MSKYVLVDALSIFRMQYAIEVPDDVTDVYEYVKSLVENGDTKEFTQKHIGETVSDYREMSLDEVCETFRNEEPYFASWSDDIIIKNNITPIGFDREAYYEEEEKRWHQNIN